MGLVEDSLILGYRTDDKVHVLFDAADPAGTAVVDAIGAIRFVSLILGAIELTLIAAGRGTWMHIGTVVALASSPVLRERQSWRE
jgi:hypothetical protein